MIEKTRSIYARKFDKNSKSWTDDRDFNKKYLKGIEIFYNTLLRARGYVFLRDIYEELGFPIDQKSIVVGWFYDSGNAFVDNYIDFNIDGSDEGPDFWLDFNVDGNIMDRFE